MLADLVKVGQQIATREDELTKLYARRLALFKEARADHGTTNRALGSAAFSDDRPDKTKENAVIAALRKDAIKKTRTTP